MTAEDPIDIDPTEQALADLLFDREARAAWRAGRPPAGLVPARARALADVDPTAIEEIAAAVRAMARERSQRGVGRLTDAFPRTIGHWRAAHPDDRLLDELFARFLASPAARGWREGPGAAPGTCIEEAFAMFAAGAGIGEAATREDERLGAVVRALVVSPDPAFVPPSAVSRVAGGWLAIAPPGGPEAVPVLHAAIDGRYLRGPITPLAADLLAGLSVDSAARRHGVEVAAASAVRDDLARRRLMPPPAQEDPDPRGGGSGSGSWSCPSG